MASHLTFIRYLINCGSFCCLCHTHALCLYATSSAVPSLRSQTRRRSRLVLSSVCLLFALSGLMIEESSRLQRFPAVNVAHNSFRLPAPFCSQIIRRGPSVLLFGCIVPALFSARSLSFFFFFESILKVHFGLAPANVFFSLSACALDVDI